MTTTPVFHQNSSPLPRCFETIARASKRGNDELKGRFPKAASAEGMAWYRASKYVTALDINCMRVPVYTLHGICRNPHFPHSYPQKVWVKPRFYRLSPGLSTFRPDLYIICPQTLVCISHISTQFRAYLGLITHFSFDFTSYLPFLIPFDSSLTLL